MSEPTTQPAGWYHAQGDPPGTQRYWDGSQWQGGPQPVPGPAAPGAFGVSPGATSPVRVHGQAPAEYGQRVIAYLIDVAVMVGIFIAGFVLVAILGAVADALGVLASIATVVGSIGYFVWNFIILQGRTGQTLGKKQQGIKLVADATAQPVGGGMVLVRYLVAAIMSGLTCGLVGLLDLLWPLWDEDNKRLTDKVLKFSVVEARLPSAPWPGETTGPGG